MAHLEKFVYWGLGLCASGFFCLAGWQIWMTRQLGGKVPYKWIEDTFQPNLQTDLKKIKTTLDKIEVALCGGFDKRGLIYIVEDIEKNCIRHKKEVAHVE